MSTGRLVMAMAVVFALMSLVTVARAEERGTKDQAKAMVDAAVEHLKKVGPEQAFKDFTTDKATWTKMAQTKGQGRVEYAWPHPQTKNLEDKVTYVRKLVNYDGWVGAGVYR